MKKMSIIIFFVTLAIILLLFSSFYAMGASNNPCGSCHSGQVYSQYLDILEGNSENQIPSGIEINETKTVSVIVENRGNPGTYPTISDVSLTLTSKYGHFSVYSSKYNIGELPLTKKSASWQITGVSEGFDSLVIRASGINKQHLALTFLFSDSYSPAPSITVGHPSPTSPPTPTPTPTNEPSPTPNPNSPTPAPSLAPINTPTPSPNAEPTSPPTEPLSILLDSPTVGERLKMGLNYTMKWSTSGGTKPLSITLDYSLSNNSESWTTIAANISDNGSFTWNTPNSTTTIYIRALVTDSSNPTQSAVIIRKVEVNEPGAPLIIIVSIVLLIAGLLPAVLLKLKKKAKFRGRRLHKSKDFLNRVILLMLLFSVIFV
ncbi:hypothetical protein E2P63_06455 [Candidatus Bathyarchaeota archaeon]|nr:hypothetical protein E2P63_06455 [Candidatus Bathyarchaeota archaeon]